MEPPNHNLPPTSFLDLNIEDRGRHHLFNLNVGQTFSSNFMNIPSQDQGQFYFREPQRNQVQEADHHKINIVSSDGPRDHHPPRAAESKSDHHHQNDLKLSIWKSTTHEDTNYDHDKSSHVSTENMDSVKWVSSKMRMMRKMIMNPDQTSTDDHTPMNFAHKFDQAVNKDPTSPLGMDHSSSSSSNNINNNAIRVCADCNTTKTPLWRSGPRGPKSLCNACGIRQRKARRAMAAAAAAANGTILATDAASLKISSAKVQRKGKKSKNGNGAALVPQFKKRCKFTASPSRGRKKICFEDLAISISKNSSAFQRVFPQDEKDAAILLMALSYGLVHG